MQAAFFLLAIYSQKREILKMKSLQVNCFMSFEIAKIIQSK
jgi:hypothetical protein